MQLSINPIMYKVSFDIMAALLQSFFKFSKVYVQNKFINSLQEFLAALFSTPCSGIG